MLDKYRTPERLTARDIPYKPERLTARQIQPETNLKVQIHYELPDELKLVIFGGFVALMAWFMLTVFVASFSQPKVIIIQPDGSIIRSE